MADEFLRIGGRSESGVAKAIRTDNDGNLRMRPTGDVIETLLTSASNTSLLTNNALYIASQVITDVTNAKGLDIRKYKNLSIIIRNSHNQAIQAKLAKRVSDSYHSNAFLISDYITIGTGETYLFDSENFPLLKVPAPFLTGDIIFNSQPTSGSVSIYIFGEVR